MPGRSGTEVIVLDLTTDAMQARRKQGRALRDLRQTTAFKALLGALILLALAALIAALRS